MNLLKLGIEENVKKGDHLLWEGERCKDLFFIKEGMLRVYYLKDGQEVTDWFGTKESVITAMESFHKQNPSDQYIQAIQQSKVIRIRKGDLVKAISNSMELKDEYLTIITHHLLRVQQRIKALQFYSAKERYELLLEKNPEVVKFGQRNQIASYLGISLETLSRVTKRLNYLINVKE
jgi:CRP-like cAMP-binding protein